MHFFEQAIPSDIYETFWYFIAERQRIFFKKIAGKQPPFTQDPILQSYKFTNVYRATDRTSQYAIQVMYSGPQTPEDIFFRTILFKLFNKIETWQALEAQLGPISYKTFRIDDYTRVLDQLFAGTTPIYSAAYIMPSPRSFHHARKHTNHIHLLYQMMKDNLPGRIAAATSLKQVYTYLTAYPTIGPFLAYQYAIDLNYSTLINFSENDFVVPGPGAIEGIHKCFSSLGSLTEGDIIRFLTTHQLTESKRYGHPFQTLYGRPLHLIDIQNVFCEIGKYARISHPHISGVSKRTNIKQSYTPEPTPYQLMFPPKWNLHVTA